MTTTDAELRAAAERLRRLKAGESAETVYAHEFTSKGGKWQLNVFLAEQDDRDKLADAYLAEHLADDSLPATVDWIDAEMTMLVTLPGPLHRRHYEIVYGVFVDANGTPDGWEPCELWTAEGDGFHSCPVTRGEVRQLVALLMKN